MSGLRFRIGEAVTEVVFAGALEPPLFARPAGALVVFDGNTERLFGGAFPATPRAVLEPGEEHKGWASVERILSRCAEAGLGRDGTVVGVGGGVVTDLAGFAAALYMRGCGLQLAPTTLLAMVDASLGGKTGMDFRGIKNLVGAFHPASRIVVCTSVLGSLPQREYASGLAEVIKTALVGDGVLWAALRDRREEFLRREPSAVRWAVERCLAVKGGICERDPREGGERALLNLGHTFGHGLEAACGFRGWTHGEAVAWGIGRAVAYGEAAGLTPASHAAEVRSLLSSYGYRAGADGVDAEAVLAAMGRDKKRRDGRLRLVLSRGVGDAETREAEEGAVRAVLASRAGGAA